MLVVLLIALKRFSLVAISMALSNFILNSGIKIRRKAAFLIVLALMFAGLLYFTDLPRIITQSYFSRGAETKISVEAVQTDVRIYEPIYVLGDAMEKGLLALLFGSQTTSEFDIDTESHFIIGRRIHSVYGQYLLQYGLFGLLVYLSLFSMSYRLGRKWLSNARKLGEFVDPIEWVTFLNIILVFVIGGMVGGHSHVTYRSFAFLVMGALGGAFSEQSIKAKYAKMAVSHQVAA